LDVALCDGVHDVGDTSGTGTAQAEVQEVALRVRANVEGLLEAPRAVPYRRHREPDPAPRREHLPRRGPQQPEPGPDGVTHDPPSERQPVRIGKRVAPPRGSDR